MRRLPGRDAGDGGLYQTYKNRGFAILGVNVKDDKKTALSFLAELNITFPTAFDPDGRVGLMYGAWGLPATYLIDGDGIALARAWGPANWFNPGARELIEALLERKKTTQVNINERRETYT